MKKKGSFIFICIIAFGVFAGVISTSVMPRPTPTTQSPGLGISQGKPESYAAYQYMTREERIDAAVAIFVGNVTAISPTRWNQDSGGEWVSNSDGPNPNSPAALPIHILTIAVDTFIVDTKNIGKEIEITVIGNSPTDGPTEHGLQVGDIAVFFVEERDLAWREGGRKKTRMMISSPADSYLIYQSDDKFHARRNDQRPVSLSELVREIAKRREVLIQP